MAPKESELDYLARKLLRKHGEMLSASEHLVLSGLLKKSPVSRDTVEEADARLTHLDRLADRVAEVGGSWGFIVSFTVFIALWVILNTWLLGRMAGAAFDPYPFIFLNLLLSTVAAFQAPVIMMSQNRQSNIDRAAARHDYEINLRAELEIMALHEKLDGLRSEQAETLLRQHSEMLEAMRVQLASLRSGNSHDQDGK